MDRFEQKRGFPAEKSKLAALSEVVLCWQEGFVSRLGGRTLCWTRDGLAFDRCLVADTA